MWWRIVIPRHPDAPPHHLLEVLLEPLLVRHQPSSDSMIEIFVKVVDRYHWAVHLKWLSIWYCYDHNCLPHWSRWVGLLTIPQTQASTLPSASHSSPPSPSASCQTSPRCHQMEVRHHQLSSPLSNYSSHSPTVLFHPIFFWEILISLDSIGIWMMYPRIEVPCVAQRNLEELEKRDQVWTKKCHFCETCVWNGDSLKSVLCHRLESWKRKGKFGLLCDGFEKQHLCGSCHGWLLCGNSSLYQA